MRTRLPLLVLVLSLLLAACGETPSTVASNGGDVSNDASDPNVTPAAETAPSVADDSAPIDLGPTTTGAPTTAPPATAPWEVTLEEYPLLTLLDDQQNASIGSASFVLVDADGNPILSGDDDLPHFIVTIQAWFGEDNYIEHTMNTYYAELRDQEIYNSTECGGTWAHLSKTSIGQYLRLNRQLPKVKNTNLAWNDDGCAERLPANYDSLFEGPISIVVTDTGFALSNTTSRLSRFAKLPARDPRPETATTIAVATTEPAVTTTELPSED